MAFTSLTDLTALDLVAWAQIQHGTTRFTQSNITGSLLPRMQLAVTPRHIYQVRPLLLEAVKDGLLRFAPGSRGGEGFVVTAVGRDLSADVEVPADWLVREENNETAPARTQAAATSAWPILVDLAERLEKRGAWKPRHFVQSVLQTWLKTGVISHRQAEVCAEIAMPLGASLDPLQIAGRANLAWRQQVHAKLQEAAEQQLQEERRRRDLEAHRRQEQKILTDRIKHTLERPEHRERLVALCTAVFPDTKLSKPSITQACSGRGARTLRCCIALLCTHEPPALIWHGVATKQPGRDDEEWLILLAHPAGQAALACPAWWIPEDSARPDAEGPHAPPP